MNCKNETFYSQELAPFSMTSFHLPLANSPQLCVVMNAQLLKPSLDRSLDRRANNVDFVFIGEMRKIWTSPRRLAVNVILA